MGTSALALALPARWNSHGSAGHERGVMQSHLRSANLAPILSGTLSSGQFHVSVLPSHGNDPASTSTYPAYVRHNEREGVTRVLVSCLAGVICAAPTQAGWFRALITVYNSNDDMALIKFLDYGGYLYVHAGSLRVLR